jgi:hypothetical protein
MKGNDLVQNLNCSPSFQFDSIHFITDNPNYKGTSCCQHKNIVRQLLFSVQHSKLSMTKKQRRTNKSSKENMHRF